MSLATDRLLQQLSLSFEEFLAAYGDDNRYELIDGEMFDFEPTGPHEEVAGLITTKVCVHLDRRGLPWFVLQRGLLRPTSPGMTAFRPDVAVIDRTALVKEPLWSESIDSHSGQFD
jgi:Uma2 family endonuclease